MRISDWSSDVCSSDLRTIGAGVAGPCPPSSQPVDKFGSPGIRGGTESAAPGMEFGCRVCPTPYAESYPQGRPARLRLPFSARRRHGAAMSRLHLHLISDSTGETLANIATATAEQRRVGKECVRTRVARC